MPKRNYRKEYDDYYGRKGRPKTWTAKQKTRRAQKASRNAARALMTKRVGKKRIRGRDVHHKNGNALDNRPSNLEIITRAKNRALNGK